MRKRLETVPAGTVPPADGGDASVADYDAFISYSRRDAAFAAALERALESYSPPSGLGRARRRLVAFRDEQDLTGSEYYRAIEAQLAKSKKLIILCSPAARGSEYVDDEIRRFAALRGSRHIVPVLLSGVPNNAAGEDDADRLAFPEALCELVRMPLAVPYADFDPGKDRLHRGVFYGAWYTLLANLLDVSRAEIEERDRKRRARTRNIWTGAVSTIVAVLTCLTIWATVERARAIHRGRVTLAGRLVAEARVPGPLDPPTVELRGLLGLEGLRRLSELDEPTADAASTLREVAALLPRHVLHLPPGQHDIAWSGDGLHAYVAGDSGVSVIGLRTGGRVATLGSSPADEVFTGEMGSLVGVIDGRGAAVLWSAPTWGRAAVIPLGDGEEAKCGAVSDDGRYVALLTAGGGRGDDARVTVWTTDSLRLVATTHLDATGVEPPAGAACLELSPDHLVARARADVSSDTMTVALWHWRPDSEPPSSPFAIPGFGTHGPPLRQWTSVVGAAWVPDSASLHLVLRDGGVVTAGASGEERDDEGVGGISAIGPAGGLLIRRTYTADPDVPLLGYDRITLIDRGTGTTRAEIAGDLGTPWLTTGDRELITSRGRMLRIWRAADGQELMRIDAGADVGSVRIAPSRRWIGTLNEDGSLDIWDTAPPGEAFRVPGGRAVATSAAAGRIAVGTGRATFVFDAATGASLATSALRGSLLAIDTAGRFVAASTEDPSRIQFGRPSTAVVDLAQRTERVTTGEATTALAFTPDGAGLLLGGRDGSVRMTKSADGAVVWRANADGTVDHLAVSADGSLAVAGLKQLDAVIVLDAADGAERLRITGRGGNAFALSDDATLLATAAEDAIEVARLADGSVVRRMPLPETLRTVRHIAFSADGGRVIAVAGSYASNFFGGGFFTEQAVFVWDAGTGDLLDRLPAAVDTARDYAATLAENDREYFGDISWSSNGRFVAARVFEDRLSAWAMPSEVTTAELRVWDLGGGSPVETYRARTAPEERLLAIDDSGHLLFTANDVLRVKDTDVARLLDDACRRVRRELTAAEWRDHVSAEEARRPTCPPGRTLP